MARMSIDDSVLRDPRVSVLARLCGWSRRETLGALLDVWAICYDHVTDVLPAEYIDVAAGPPDFTKHLIAAGLASESARGVSVKGVKQRIEYLEAKVSAGRLGGRKSGESRRETSKQTRSTARSTPQAPPNPIPTVPDPALAPVLAVVDLPDPVLAQRGRSPVGDRDPVTHKPAVDAFHAYYVATHDGSKPTWGAKQVAQLKRLVKAHGVAEVVRRVGVLTSAPPRWPVGPWDLATFVQHFDKVAAADGGGGGAGAFFAGIDQFQRDQARREVSR